MAGTAKKSAATPKKAKEPTVLAFKGFDPDFKCRGFQYAVGETYEHTGDVRMCAKGFHCIDGNPLDVLDYYPLIGDDGRPNRFATVIASGEIARDETSKICAAELTVSAELKIPDLIASAVKLIMASCKTNGKDVQAASGNSSQLAASGNSSQLAASGNSSKLAASGKNSVIAASAPYCTASGADGTWISLAEFDRNGKCIGFAVGCIGQGGLKSDTAYIARNGKLVEAN